MKLLSAICLFLLLGLSELKAQDQQNIGFEDGNLLGWEFEHGEVIDDTADITFQNLTRGFLPGRLELLDRDSRGDPSITVENIRPVLRGNYSLRIGNTREGGTFDRMKTKFKVASYGLIYEFYLAAILHNDRNNNHPEGGKPSVYLTLRDQNENRIDCGSFAKQLDGTLPEGFLQERDYMYRNWSTGSLNLDPYVGQTLTLELTVHGCTADGHRGYAYFDSEIRKLELDLDSPCPDEDGFLSLNAPFGYVGYNWNNGQPGQNLKVSLPVDDEFAVKLTPHNNLNPGCMPELRKAIKVASKDTTISQTLCGGKAFRVGDTTFTTTGSFTHKIKSSTGCDSTFLLNLTFTDPLERSKTINLCKGEKYLLGDQEIDSEGIFRVRYNGSNGCDSIAILEVNVENIEVNAETKLTIPEGEPIPLKAEVDADAPYVITWSRGDTLICIDCASTEVLATNSGSYDFRLTSQSGICRIEKTLEVNVVPCGIYIPTAFSPNSDGVNDYFNIYGSPCIENINTLSIANRLGQVVFSKTDIPHGSFEKLWDGRWFGELVASGEYYYQMTYQKTSGLSGSQNGSLTIMR
ncbi:gliding motility-associated C-terminal domain-containing protein [Jiulongibacter sediminis]|jgi:gliding motility-associated-like protein|uniref:gliding motility-associated C-terminal domain-containing protein n=1 Tax=Jiulongibacter sediminis TaxID=1605367 RepID=UPI0026F20BCD|nr:gliding motility-associated C-terminal domain-containing protein [Jiulongibacter sediminis]